MGSAPFPWVIMDRTGATTECTKRVEWLAEWRHRIRAIEAANRPAELRREGLERVRAANAGAFQVLVEHGALDAVLDVTGAAAAADARLSGLDTSQEIAA
jgi:molybdopterin-guanine dinucleotide biosynthesis protein